MLSTRLKEARKKADLTQKEVAELTGIATTTYSGYERGKSDPDVNTLGRLMQVLNVDANYLYQDSFQNALAEGDKDATRKFEPNSNRKMLTRILEDMSDELVDEIVSHLRKYIK